MEFRPLRIEGAVEVTPRQYSDPRGVLAEGFRADRLAEQIGHEFTVRQTNISVSRSGALRGIHYASLPPSQAKYVTAVEGAFLDFIIDIRVGSPTFGQWDVVRLDTIERKAVYLSEGLGHALVCVEDGTTVYLCSEVYNPAAELGLNPLDPTIGLDLPSGLPLIVSDKDAAAMTLLQAQAAALLPDYAACLDFRSSRSA